MPAPPALGSSSGGMGVGVLVAVAVGTGVRVGVIVGGGVGVGVLVATMSYEPTPFSQRTHVIPATHPRHSREGGNLSAHIQRIHVAII